MNTIEENRRKRGDVCSGCGWGLVEDDESFACVNDRCVRVGRHVRVIRVTGEARKLKVW